MQILILEDEPIIAVDLEDIVTSGMLNVECMLAGNARTGRRRIEEGVDFAILDIHFDQEADECCAIAAQLFERDVPFCFITSDRTAIKERYATAPVIDMPFRPAEITGAVSLAA